MINKGMIGEVYLSKYLLVVIIPLRNNNIRVFG